MYSRQGYFLVVDINEALGRAVSIGIVVELLC